MSGPVGGIMGGNYLAKTLGGLDNLVCADMGGTSFDAGCITAGILPINREAPFRPQDVNVPMLDIRSIGAGTGASRQGPPRACGCTSVRARTAAGPAPLFQEQGNE